MSEEEIRKKYKCLHLADYSLNQKMCKAIEKIIEQQKEIEELNDIHKFAKDRIAEDYIAENEQLKKEIDELKADNYELNCRINDLLKEE